MSPIPIWVTRNQEISVLEACLKEAQSQLRYFRRVGDQLRADLTEADVNRMLEELAHHYKHRGRILRP